MKLNENHKLGRKVYYKNGCKRFIGWHNARMQYDTKIVRIEIGIPFKGSIVKDMEAYKIDDEYFVECGIDHYNAHISNFRDTTNIYGVYLKKVVG